MYKTFLYCLKLFKGLEGAMLGSSKYWRNELENVHLPFFIMQFFLDVIIIIFKFNDNDRVTNSHQM